MNIFSSTRLRTALFCAAAASAALLGACRAGAPAYFGGTEPGKGAILVGIRLLDNSEELKEGRLRIDIESDEERYGLILHPGRTVLVQVEPGDYRLLPEKTLFGGARTDISIVMKRRSYRMNFPRDLLRMEALPVKPGKVAAMGFIEAKLLPHAPGERPKILLRLDSSVDARRQNISDLIARMMDPQTPQSLREGAVSWARPLEQALVRVQGEKDSAPSYLAP
ncbi:MAG: hypothetical protein WCU88_04465 [Elusimicrobiota bacterium]|jgi:hypothetical protein